VNLEDQIQLVAFRVGSQEFALEILQVERILRYERPAPLPKSPDYLEGVVTYAGLPIPVVDLRKRLEVPAPIDEQTRLMVLALEDQRVAVIVDDVREVLRIDSTTIIAPPPIVRGLAAAYIAGLVTRGERTLVLLQAAKLLSSTERLALSDAVMVA
jgi:purine-binding chemotaxis protein CheW